MEVFPRNNRLQSNFVGISLLLGFLLPHTSILFLIVNPLLCLLLLIIKRFRVNLYSILWVIPFLLSFFLNYNQGISTKSVLATITLIMYILVFPFCGRVKISIHVFNIILGVIVFSQFIYILNISYFKELLDTFYPISELDLNSIDYMKDNINLSNINDFRLGGIYRNSNHCAKYVSLLLCSYLVLFNDRKLFSRITFIVISLTSIILTGSRTGFVIGFFIVFVYLFMYPVKGVLIKKVWPIIFIAGLFLYLVFYSNDLFRSTDVVQGFSNSAYHKVATFFSYLSNENSGIKLLLGYFDSSRYVAQIGYLGIFDSDYGDIIFCYGFIGFVFLLFFLYQLYKKIDKLGKLFFLTLGWVVSSTVITSYRASFVFFLLLSILYSYKRKDVFSLNN